jgi:hypothetical protein
VGISEIEWSAGALLGDAVEQRQMLWVSGRPGGKPNDDELGGAMPLLAASKSAPSDGSTKGSADGKGGGKPVTSRLVGMLGLGGSKLYGRRKKAVRISDHGHAERRPMSTRRPYTQRRHAHAHRTSMPLHDEASTRAQRLRTKAADVRRACVPPTCVVLCRACVPRSAHVGGAAGRR